MTQDHSARRPLDYGIPWLDAQHAHIVEFIEANLRRRRSDYGEAARTTLLELLRYCAIHFDAEEDLMREVDYPELNVHVLEHRRLLEKIEGLVQLHLEAGALAKELPALLETWINDHLGCHDVDLGRFLAEHPTRLAVYISRNSILPATRSAAASG